MTGSSSSAGLVDYLKAAFLFRWNLLFFLGAAAAAAISPLRDAVLPLIGAAEIAYLAAMVGTPAFRSAIDARVHAARRAGTDRATAAGGDPMAAFATLLAGLDDRARSRFDRLRERCVQMRAIASGVGGRAGGTRASDELHSPALDRLLWVFLRLLYSQGSLARFLATTDGADIERTLQATKTRLAEAERANAPGSERLLRSLRDALATQDVRLDNYRRAHGNAEFVAVELDRLEGKIQALSEMAVNRQDPDFISREVDSVAQSMQQTEKAISEISLVDGLIEDLGEAPPILTADLRKVTETR